MPIPEITTIQSVLGFRQWQPWQFQPHAANLPTSWACSPLPPGCVFDTATGRILGPATAPGVYNFELRAINASGTSTPKVFTLGIEATGFIQPSNIIELYVDVTTRRVSLTPIFAEDSVAQMAEDSKAIKKKLPPLVWIKAGDVLIFCLRFVKGGVVADLDLTDLKFVLKEFEPEGVICAAGGAGNWQKIGTNDAAAYRLAVDLSEPTVYAALINYEADQETGFLSLAEFEWKENNPTTPRIGPAIIRGSTRTFGAHVTRDLIANA